MSFDQGEFNFEAKGSEAGYRRWREELDERKRAFESRWGVSLGKRVTVSLKNHAKPLVGLLDVIQLPGSSRNAPPRFRLRGLEFGVDEIESLIQETDA